MSNVESLSDSDDDFSNIQTSTTLFRVSSLQLRRASAFVVQEYNHEYPMADPPDSDGSQGCRRPQGRGLWDSLRAPAAGTFL